VNLYFLQGYFRKHTKEGLKHKKGLDLTAMKYTLEDSRSPLEDTMLKQSQSGGVLGLGGPMPRPVDLG
jgi:hypothetical protein